MDEQINLTEHFLKTSSKAKSELINFLNIISPKLLLSALAAKFFFIRSDVNPAVHNELHPSYQLELLAGLILSGSYSGARETVYPDEIEEAHNALKMYSWKSFNPESEDKFVQHVVDTFHTVRGDFYAWQTKERIQKVLATYDRYFEKHIELSPTKLMDFITKFPDMLNGEGERLREEFAYNVEFARLISSIEKKGKSFKIAHDGKEIIFRNEDECKDYVDNFIVYNAISKALLMNPENIDRYGLCIDELKSMQVMIGVSKANFNKLGGFKNYPLCILEDGDCIFLGFHTSLDAMYHNFDLIAKRDSKFIQRYQKNKSNYAEEKSYEVFSNIFKPEHIYRNVLYPDLNNTEGGQAELDIAISYHNFLILCEVKSKQIREESLSGDIPKLRSDLKSNLADSHQQAKRALGYIQSTQDAKFKEKDSDRELVVSKGNVHKVFVISITFESISDIGTRMSELEGLRLFKDSEYPFSISIPELGVISLSDILPETFFHYMTKRLELLKEDTKWLGDELDLFACYLANRLIIENLNLPNDGKPINLLSISGCSDKFIALDDPDCDPKKIMSTMKVDFPAETAELLNSLGNQGSSSASWILFKLHDLPNEMIAWTYEAMRQAKARTSAGYSRVNRYYKDTVICVVTTQTESRENLVTFTRMKVILEKYKSKSKVAIGFSVLSKSPNLFEAIDFFNFDWEHDDVLEKQVSETPKAIARINGKSPERNKPCPCGSGKKFKKCCYLLL